MKQFNSIIKRSLIFCLIITMLCLNTACSNNNEETTAAKPLEGQTLFVYCGAGMTKPFEDIVDVFQTETGATVEVTFGNAAQIITQINTMQQGDLFIAGDQNDLEKIQGDVVTEATPLVKHIPVIAVPAGNPKNITGLQDFANEGVRVVLGDNQATPIGNLADKALQKAGILDKVNIIARAASAPEVANALALGECDASILWKENANIEGVEVINSPDMEPFIKTIPAASLSCGINQEVLTAFLEFLNTKTATDIWEKYGYELIAK